jgi:hypothetical protein
MSVHTENKNYEKSATHELFKLMIKGEEATNTSTNCEHSFEFVPLCGTYCTKCHIPYGIECLHPDCKVHNCEIHMLKYDAFEEKDYGGVNADMTDDIYLLHLGHDGVLLRLPEQVGGVVLARRRGLDVAHDVGVIGGGGTLDHSKRQAKGTKHERDSELHVFLPLMAVLRPVWAASRPPVNCRRER